LMPRERLRRSLGIKNRDRRTTRSDETPASARCCTGATRGSPERFDRACAEYRGRRAPGQDNAADRPMLPFQVEQLLPLGPATDYRADTERVLTPRQGADLSFARSVHLVLAGRLRPAASARLGPPGRNMVEWAAEWPSDAVSV
jgi:hypothetical protein